MATISNEVIIAGQPYELGGDIAVINFRDNLDYSFFDPIGGQCAPDPGGGGGGGGSVPGLNVPGANVQVEEDSGPRRRYYYRDGMRQSQLASMSPEQMIEKLNDRDVLRYVVVHHDATYTAHHCFGVLCNRGLSTHFIVNHDGGIIQGLDPIYTAYHAGEFNGRSIGIDMNNVAVVEGHQTTYPDPAFGGAVDYSVREIVEGRINNSTKESFIYTEPQYNSLCALLKLFHDVFGLPLIFPQSDTGGVVTSRLSDPHNFVGFYGHWHCQAGKWDPGPGFDWERVMEGLHGKANYWPVDLDTATLRDLRSQDSVDEATNIFFRAIEEGPAGGGYPIGLNQEWHDGVHIHCEQGTPIYSVAEGEIILTRNGPNLPLGSPNFVLMRHKIEREIVEYDAQGNAEVSVDTVPWYSLYMHMDRMFPREVVDPDAVQEEPPEGEEPERREQDGTVNNRDIPSWYQLLVQRARESKGGRLQPDNDYEVVGVEDNPRQYETTFRGLLRVQEFRNAHECVEAGNPFQWIDPRDEESVGIEVGGGTLLGYVGQFGHYTRDGRVEMNSLVQVQIFSTTPIFDDTRFDVNTWRRVQGDLTGNSLVSVPDVIQPIRNFAADRAISAEEEEEGGPQIDLGRGRIITPSEVSRFFQSGTVAGKHRMRTIIAQHMSEWDIAVDDSLTANIPIAWPWQNEEEFLFWRALNVGYKWLNDDTRRLLGMEEGPTPIITYHPIYLLGWWALNYGRALQGQTFEGLGGEELREALEAEGELEVEGLSEEATIINLEDITEVIVEYPDLEDLENGEWHHNVRFRNPLGRGR